jgi:hypothetical protein
MFQYILLLCLLCSSQITLCKQINNDIERVHIIFSTHLDVGYNSPFNSKFYPAFAIEIINGYLDYHFPQILLNINQLADNNINYIYTTHAWLVYIYIHCESNLIPIVDNVTLHCPNQDLINEFKRAIVNGNIVWHAIPFNTHTEMQNKFVFDNQIKFVHALDDEFGLPHKTVMSQRDVPGLTAAVIPILLENGITSINIGANEMSGAPVVPSIFRWQHPLNSTWEIIASWHPGGYGGCATRDAIIIPNYPDILCYWWTNDNSGPGEPKEILGVIKIIKL